MAFAASDSTVDPNTAPYIVFFADPEFAGFGALGSARGGVLGNTSSIEMVTDLSQLGGAVVEMNATAAALLAANPTLIVELNGRISVKSLDDIGALEEGVALSDSATTVAVDCPAPYDLRPGEDGRATRHPLWFDSLASVADALPDGAVLPPIDRVGRAPKIDQGAVQVGSRATFNSRRGLPVDRRPTDPR